MVFPEVCRGVNQLDYRLPGSMLRATCECSGLIEFHLASDSDGIRLTGDESKPSHIFEPIEDAKCIRIWTELSLRIQLLKLSIYDYCSLSKKGQLEDGDMHAGCDA